MLVIKFFLCFIFVEQIFTNITTRTNCYTSNINITPRFSPFPDYLKWPETIKCPPFVFFPQNNKSYQPLSDSSDNNNKSHFHPDSNSDFLALVRWTETNWQTDRQTSCRRLQSSNGARQISLYIWQQSPVAKGVRLETRPTHTDLPWDREQLRWFSVSMRLGSDRTREHNLHYKVLPKISLSHTTILRLSKIKSN